MTPSHVTVVERFHSLFYAPQYVALHLGYFAREGLEVTVQMAGSGPSMVQALLDGTAEIGLGGLMRSLELADRGGGILVFSSRGSRSSSSSWPRVSPQPPVQEDLLEIVEAGMAQDRIAGPGPLPEIALDGPRADAGIGFTLPSGL